MEFRKVLALRGPNIWTNAPVIEAWVDLKELDRPSTDFPGFSDRLMSWLPTMIEHRCSIGERGGFFQRLRDGTYPAIFSSMSPWNCSRLPAGKSDSDGPARCRRRAFIAWSSSTTTSNWRWTASMRRGSLFWRRSTIGPIDVKAEIERLRDFAHEACLGPSTSAIVDAAKARGIPVRRLNTDSLVQFGYGTKLRRIQAAETDRTGAIAETIAQDKELTRTLLKAVGVPVPEGRPVTDADDAWAAACDIGVPVVVKPRDGNQGRGVATNLTTREQILAAYQAALAESKQVVVEKFAPGHDYRILVVGGKVVAAARREPAQVLGDGVRTIRELVDAVNLDPRRGEHHATVLSKIKLDAVALGVLGRSRLYARFRAARRHRGPHSPQRQPEHRRHGHRRDRAGPSAGGGPRRGSGRR